LSGSSAPALASYDDCIDFAGEFPVGFNDANGRAGTLKPTVSAGTQRLTRTRRTIRENVRKLKEPKNRRTKNQDTILVLRFLVLGNSGTKKCAEHLHSRH
jgi:hypothetical protein